MKILFTKSNKIGSKLIQWGLDEPVSHVAVLFESVENTMFHATFSGVKKETLESFLTHNEIVYNLDYNMLPVDEEIIYEKVYNKYNGDSYDVGAFVFFSICVFFKKLFKIPLPKTNPWNSTRNEICTEVAVSILNLQDVDASMLSPYQLYLILKAK